MRGRRHAPWGIGALLALALALAIPAGASCSDDAPDAGDDTHLNDTPDTSGDAGGADTDAETSEDAARPDVAPDASVDEDVDAPDSSDPSDAGDVDLPTGTFSLACQSNDDCAAPCGQGQCRDALCTFPGPQTGCVLVDAQAGTGACIEPGTVAPDSTCLFCNPRVQGEGFTSISFRADFEDGADGFVVEALGPASANWSLSSERAASGTRSLYFGNPETRSYDVGERAAASARTPPLTVPAGARLTLGFELFLDTEETAAFDFVRVLVDQGTDAQPVEVWHSDVLGGTTWGEFLPISLDLGDLSVDGMQIIFEFDSVDGIINDFEGAYLDNVVLITGCCSDDSHCVDVNACTVDRCGDDGSCAFEALEACCLIDGDCDDGDACTDDVCPDVGGSCDHRAIAGCCHDTSDCNDDDPCTEDSCPGDGELCVHQPLCCQQDGDCDDGDSCTIGSCHGGQCSYTLACCEDDDDCDDDDACTMDTCRSGGVCQNTFSFRPGCCRPDVLTQRFDGDTLTDWSLDPAVGNVGWRLQTTDAAPSGTGVLYYGHPTLIYYDNGSPNLGTTTSANIRLPDDVSIQLSLSALLDIEDGPFKDVFTVSAQVGDESVTLLEKADFTLGQWSAASVDISYLAGQNVRLVFAFDTVDALANNTKGIMIDDLRILSSCQPRACADDSACNSEARCITGVCALSGTCLYDGDC